MLADQIISLIQFVHATNFLHRDIKPENFLIGTFKLGVCDRFRSGKKVQRPENQLAYTLQRRQNLTGTARYASVSTHLGIQQSRRDYLQGLGYVLMYFLKGQLPQQGLHGNNKRDKYQRIMDRKVNISVDQICQGYPAEFETYIHYTRQRRFEDRLDYSYLKRVCKDLVFRENFQYDFMYDWVVLRDSKKQEEERKEKRSSNPQRVDNPKIVKNPS